MWWTGLGVQGRSWRAEDDIGKILSTLCENIR